MSAIKGPSFQVYREEVTRLCDRLIVVSSGCDGTHHVQRHVVRFRSGHEKIEDGLKIRAKVTYVKKGRCDHQTCRKKKEAKCFVGY